MFMKTFEEKWTAWLDGELAGDELLAFEASLPDRAAAEAEKREAKKLGALLKQELCARSLANAEFFSHQLSERIAGEGSLRGRAARAASRNWWTVPRLVLSGAAALALFVIFSITFVHDKTTETPSPYLTQILNARVDPGVSPDASVTMFESKEARVTVIWTEGLRSLPSEYASK
jgi:hypothetical protein